ncbi:hypothetical protein [Brevibacillus sp. Leaf182]|uniref:hypothetical protein n=1 Tax=Brevibacillus sp. Leaf182 TaxID=1736290 RepID=UPI0006F456D4|nr:hypothetical protein [Brevibacillus sp. Leaf182]
MISTLNRLTRFLLLVLVVTIFASTPQVANARICAIAPSNMMMQDNKDTAWNNVQPTAECDPKPASPVKLDDKYLKKNNVDAHKLKKANVPKGANISHYDIYEDKYDDYLWLGKKKQGRNEWIQLFFDIIDAADMFPLRRNIPEH